MTNVPPAGKNLGTTHLTNGCYRLLPVAWNIGKPVGECAAFCAAGQHASHAVRQHPTLLADYQARLTAAGVPLAWPRPTYPERVSTGHRSLPPSSTGCHGSKL